MPNHSRSVGFVLIATGILLLMVIGVALANGLPPGGTFTDDNGNTHEGNIEAIAARGITKGCNPPANTLYCPSETVTRGQMAAFLNRALALPATGTDFFADDDGTTFEADINRLAAAGITKGCNPPANDRYCPDGRVTRGQMAAFLVRAFGYTDDGGGDLFVDDDGSIFEADIDRLGTAGVTKGCNPPTNDRYCPDNPVLRDQMASFLARALGYPPITPPPPTTTLPPESFGDGTWIVGKDISPGTYRTAASPDLCYAERLSGFGGTLGEIIANELSYAPLIVTIKPTDAGFSSDDCGLWSNDTTPRTATPTSAFGEGYWVVGTEVAPGLWRSGKTADWCYWERLSGFSWRLSDIIANGLDTAVQTVRIGAGDTGFHSEDCGVWTYLGP